MGQFYEVEIDKERPDEEGATKHRNRSLETGSGVQQSFSALSSDTSDYGSETSLDIGNCTDEENSILYSMKSRPYSGLKQLCEVPLELGDEETFLSQEQTAQLRPTKEALNGRKGESKIKTNNKIDKNKEDVENSSSSLSCCTKAIAFALVVVLLFTVILVIVLVSNLRNQGKSGNTVTMDGNIVTQDQAFESLEGSNDLQQATSPSSQPTMMPTYHPTQKPSSTKADAYSYTLDFLSNYTKKEFLLDASRPQGRAFLQIVMDNKDSFETLSQTRILQTYGVLTLYYSTSPKLLNRAFSLTQDTSNICSWDGLVSCNELDSDDEQVVEEIAFSGVGLSGILPEEVCLLEYLERLDLRGNRISGEIPQCLVNLEFLKILLLGSNSFTGYLPSGSLLVPALEELDFSNNYLQGNLDMLIAGEYGKSLLFRYGETWKLRRLSLENNFLSGDVPAFLGVLLGLNSLTLHGNDLKGQVKDTVCDRTRDSLKELTADCGEVVCSCCTACYKD